MVISGLLTWCVYELLKEASGKCSGGSNIPYFTLLSERQQVAKQFGPQQVECFCEVFQF